MVDPRLPDGILRFEIGEELEKRDGKNGKSHLFFYSNHFEGICKIYPHLKNSLIINKKFEKNGKTLNCTFTYGIEDHEEDSKYVGVYWFHIQRKYQPDRIECEMTDPTQLKILEDFVADLLGRF